MAAQKREIVKSLEEEVKCPLCMDIFSDPKKLPCDHVICCECLGDLIRRSRNGILTCPVCRDTTPLQGPEASHFPTAHQTNRLIDIYKKTLQEQIESTPAPQPATVSESELPMCSVHTTEALALYCETCKKSVCRDCALTSCAIKKHDYKYIKDIAQKYEDELLDGVVPIIRAQKNISAALAGIMKTDEKLKSQKKEEEQELDAAYDLIMSRVMEEKLKIKQDIEERFQQQALSNLYKTEELTTTLNEVETCTILVDSVLMEENIVAKFNKIIAVTKTVEELHHQIKTLTLESTPFEGLEVKLELLPGSFDAKRFLYQTRKGCKYLWTEYEMLKYLKLSEPFKIDLHFTSEFSEPQIESSFISLFGNSSTPVSITKLPSNIVRIEFTPQHRGRHELHIQLQDNTAICGSPVSSYVYVDPKQISSLGKPKQTIISDACSVKCVEDKLYVTSAAKEIILLEHRKPSRGLKIAQSNLVITKRFSASGINDILIWNQFVYYSNTITNTVEKKNRDSLITLTSVGGYGTDPGLFKSPNGIRISRQSEVYVCDSGNHRIQVFDTDLNLLRVIGEKGTTPGQFLTPHDLVFDDHDNIYVVDHHNKRVQVLSPQGDHVRFIGTSEDYSLSKPISPAIHGGHIYVTEEGKNGISVFTLAGKFVSFFGQNQSTCPECIDIDRDGHIYVTSGRRKVFMY